MTGANGENNSGIRAAVQEGTERLAVGIGDAQHALVGLISDGFNSIARPLPETLTTQSGIEVEISQKGQLDFSIDGQDYKIPGWSGGNIVVDGQSYRGTDQFARENPDAAHSALDVVDELQRSFDAHVANVGEDQTPFNADAFERRLGTFSDALEKSFEKAPALPSATPVIG